MIKDLFGILVIVSVDKLIDECTETIEEVKLAIITFAENENENIIFNWIKFYWMNI